MTVKTKIGTITATKETLNAIAIALYQASRYNEQCNYTAVQKRNRISSDEIYKALENKGYYDNF